MPLDANGWISADIPSAPTIVEADLVRQGPTQLPQDTCPGEQFRCDGNHEAQHGQATIPKLSLLTPSPLDLTVRCHHQSILEEKRLPILVGFPATGSSVPASAAGLDLDRPEAAC